MSPEEKRDDIFEVEDIDETPPPQEFKRPKGLLDLQKKKEQEPVELKSGASGAKPPPLTPAHASPKGPPASPPRAAAKAPAPSVPSWTPDVRTARPAPRAAHMDDLRADIDQADIRMHKAEPTSKPPPVDVPQEFDVKKDQTQTKRPSLQPLEGPVEVVRQEAGKSVRPTLKPLDGPVEVLKPAAESRPKPPPLPTIEGDLEIVKDVHAKTPQSDRLKVTKPRKMIGIVDTTFARVDMGKAAHDELRKLGGEYDVLRRTVPGIKDLAVECKILFEEEDCDIVVACGMVGGQPIDKQCAHEASLAIQWAMLATNRHILEVFVHEDEAKDEEQLGWLMERRTREHAANAHWMMTEPAKLREWAGHGLRQGFGDAGPIRRA